ncbi:MAG TPA: Uma2 family endonuclease [Thermomicrobiales bacterium]|nr:Uma2 family endonuclease [Thermomicrobiales bacterium]
MATTKLMTADELLAMPDDGRLWELRRGVLREVSPSGFESSAIAAAIGAWLTLYVIEHGLGIVTSADGGYVFEHDPDTVLAPDVAFVRPEHCPSPEVRHKFGPIPPDLAVEVVSPTDRPRAVAEKVAIYLATGVPLVWVVDPATRSAEVHRPGRQPRSLTIDDAFDGEEIVPGFRLPLAQVFAAVRGRT